MTCHCVEPVEHRRYEFAMLPMGVQNELVERVHMLVGANKVTKEHLIEVRSELSLNMFKDSAFNWLDITRLGAPDRQ